jgi:hypothetical protein
MTQKEEAAEVARLLHLDELAKRVEVATTDELAKLARRAKEASWN